MVAGQSWGCAPHFKCLPLDLRAKVHKAFGPPKASYFPKVQEKIEQWVKNQHPGNYPGVPFYPTG